VQTDVLVVGGGPAGCAAAIALARKGARVLLLERMRRPQPKTCGDALLPDALLALGALGLDEQVRAAGRSLGAVAVTAPRGRTVRLQAESVTLQRQHLHALLQAEAERCGVEVRTGEALAPLVEGEQVVGVHVRGERQAEFSLRAPLTILASGARPGTLRDFGVCLREAPSAVACRAYFRDLRGAAGDELHISYDRHISPGYGWVFPLPGGLCNIGCGWFAGHRAVSQAELQRLFEYFLRTFPVARAVAEQDDMLGVPCGGLLRTGLCGAAPSRAGLLVAGEALGSTLPFICAGVGKALETGLLAAQVAAESLQSGDFSTAALSRYSALLEQRYRTLYRGYQRAQDWLGRSRLPDLLARQVERKPRMRSAVESMLAGRLLPSAVFSLSGLLGRPGRSSRHLPPGMP